MVVGEAQTPRGTITSHFSIAGKHFDPDSLSTLIGIEPSEIWRPSNPWVRNRSDIAQIEWRYFLSRRPHWSIDDAIREMLNIFSARHEKIQAFARQHNCEVHLRLSLHADETVIVYEISAETVALLAALGCSLSFHIDPHKLAESGDGAQ
jgi:Domain of unknown function (DUF4279)